MTPRNIRNNNPLNIRRSKDKWQGLDAKQSDSSFFKFESMEMGWRAAFVILTKGIRPHWHRFRRAIRYPVALSIPLDGPRSGDGYRRGRSSACRIPHDERLDPRKGRAVTQGRRGILTFAPVSNKIMSLFYDFLCSSRNYYYLCPENKNTKNN